MRHRHNGEFIFDNEFPQWDETSDAVTMQATGLDKSVLEARIAQYAEMEMKTGFRYPISATGVSQDHYNLASSLASRVVGAVRIFKLGF
jgi:hypothetical protein